MLTSTSPGEISSTAPELGGSVFGHFLYDGLHGEADGFHVKADGSHVADDARRNGKVSLGELYCYLRTKVDSWVRDHRDDRQQPMLFDKDGEIQLFGASGEDSEAKKNREQKLKTLDGVQLVFSCSKPLEKVPPSAISRLGSEQKERIRQAWIEHENLLNAKVYATSPLKWEKYQRSLMRMERLTLAGEIGSDRYIATELTRSKAPRTS